MTDDGQEVVLIVDDEENVAEVFSLWLSGDYEVRVALDGEAALAQMDDVDVVLLDRRMPDRSGDEVLVEIRDRGYRARVAMVTAVDPDFDIVEMGFDDYITKPVSEEELRDAVERLLALSDYDERSREHFALAQKLAALEVEKTDDELESSEEYRALRDRFEDVRDEMDDIVADLGGQTRAILFRDLDRNSK